jgi:hypothetical protein
MRLAGDPVVVDCSDDGWLLTLRDSDDASSGTGTHRRRYVG